jgi:hypothetical protein
MAPNDPPEAGTVTTEQAQMLLLLDKPADLKVLERAGAFKQIAPGRYWLKDLVQGFVRHSRETKDHTTAAVLASVFGVTTTRVNQLWTDACSGWAKFMRAEDRRSTRSSSDSRMRDAKARDIEVRTQQRLSRLVPLEVYEEMIDSITGVIRSEFAGLAVVTTRDLAMRRIIEREVNARLKRIAEYAMAQAIRLETVRGVDDAERADGAGHLGGGKQDVSTNSSGAGTA